MIDFGDTPSSRSPRSSSILNRAIPLFLAGLAVASPSGWACSTSVSRASTGWPVLPPRPAPRSTLPGPLHVVSSSSWPCWSGACGPASSPCSRRPAGSARSSARSCSISSRSGRRRPAHRAVPGARERADRDDQEDPGVGLAPRPQRLLHPLGLASRAAQLYGFLIVASSSASPSPCSSTGPASASTCG